MEVIDIPSSPEPTEFPRAGPSKQRHRPSLSRGKRPVAARNHRASLDLDVIEISDSDDFQVTLDIRKGDRKGKGKGKALEDTNVSSQASERLRNDKRKAIQHPVSSPNGTGSLPVTRNQSYSPCGTGANNLAIPLFLPSDEESTPPELGVEGLLNQAVFLPIVSGRSASPVPLSGPRVNPLVPASPERELPSPLRTRSTSATPPADPVGAYVARVLEIIPDVQPEHVHTLVEQYLPLYHEQTVEPVLHLLFENPNYPKIDRKGKRKHIEEDYASGTFVEDRAQKRIKVQADFSSKDRPFRGGPDYVDLALEQLLQDFPYIPKPHIRKTFAQNRFYAPTFLFLAEEKKRGQLPYLPKTIPTRVTGKGRAKQDVAFFEEHQWLISKLEEGIHKSDAVGAEEEESDGGNGIECGCCFSTYPFAKMIQCPDAHLFCSSCVTSYASTLLGEHDPKINCMDQSGCKEPFPESELRRLLSPTLMALYDRVRQRKEIEAAGLEGLEECPFCEYKVVIENPEEKLFRCENVECGQVTCRACKKPDHLPKSCKEVGEEKTLDARHAIEEAMTQALMRNCPKCQKAFVKEFGCNKMTCPNCNTVSCYVCRKIIKGYDHFGNQTQPDSRTRDPTKCALWDSLEQRHMSDVKAAAEKALKEFKEQNPDVDEKDIPIDLLEVPVDPAPAHRGIGIFPAVPVPPPHVVGPVNFPYLPFHPHPFVQGFPPLFNYAPPGPAYQDMNALRPPAPAMHAFHPLVPAPAPVAMKEQDRVLRTRRQARPAQALKKTAGNARRRK